MQISKFKVYYTVPHTTYSMGVECSSLQEMLKTAEVFRKQGMWLVVMASEQAESIGASGVDSVANGLLPNGDPYTWKMRRI